MHMVHNNIKMILAIDKNNLVGNTKSKNGLPWHYPEDFELFKKYTRNKNILFGKSTFDSVGCLKDMNTYILTSKKSHIKGVKKFNSVDDVLKFAENNEIIICGGVSIYKEFFKYASEVLVTRIDDDHKGDVYFDNFDSYLKDFELQNSVDGLNVKLKAELWRMI